MRNQNHRKENSSHRQRDSSDSEHDEPIDAAGLVTDGGTDRPDPATVHDALAHEYRILAVEFLAKNGHGHLDRITDFVAERTTGSPEYVRRALYHAHLPKLEQTGVVLFDMDALEATATDVTAVANDIASYVDLQLGDADDGEGEGVLIPDGGGVPVVLCRNDDRRMRQTENGYSCPECGHIAGVRVEVSS